MGLDFNYHHLYYFFSIAKSGTIANASRELNVSAAALSHQLSQFERANKRRLFDRSAGKLIMTQDGRMFYDFARQIFTLGDQLANRMRSQTASGAPGLRIGLVAGAEAPTGALIEFVLRHHPNAEIVLESGAVDEFLPKIGDLRLDLLVSCSASHQVKGALLETRSLGEATIHFLTTKGGESSKIASKQLVFILPPLVVETDKRVRNYLERFSIKSLIDVPTSEIALSLSMAGRGIAICDDITLRSSPLRNRLRAAVDFKHDITQTFYLTTSPRETMNPVAERVMKSFRFPRSGGR